MRKIKLKALRLCLSLGILISIFDPLPLNSNRENAVEIKKSSVDCEIYTNRGFNENYYSEIYSYVPTIIPTDIPTPMVTDIKEKYTKEDLKLLAGIIENEAGSDFCNDEMQLAVASVVINRVNSDQFPDTIKKVIFQKNPKQYAINKKIFKHPSTRAYKNAKYVLENGSTLPENCLFQSEFKQGKVYKKFKTIISTTYICFKD